MKQTTREEPGAHPEHVEGDGRAGGTTERRFDGHSDHGGVNHVGDGVSATTVGKTTKQQGIKHHDIETKPKVHRSRATAHRRALATEMRLRR